MADSREVYWTAWSLCLLVVMVTRDNRQEMNLMSRLQCLFFYISEQHNWFLTSSFLMRWMPTGLEAGVTIRKLHSTLARLCYSTTSLLCKSVIICISIKDVWMSFVPHLLYLYEKNIEISGRRYTGVGKHTSVAADFAIWRCASPLAFPWADVTLVFTCVSMPTGSAVTVSTVTLAVAWKQSRKHTMTPSFSFQLSCFFKISCQNISLQTRWHVQHFVFYWF